MVSEMLGSGEPTPIPHFPAASMFMGQLMAKMRFQKKPPAPRKPAERDDPIWGEVLRKHFDVKSAAIMETLQKWERQEATVRHSTPGYSPKGMGISEGMAKLRHELKRYGFLQ
jgi:baculoviral IAP repeat-containing protein 6